MIAKSGIYGTRDAGRGFWLKLQRRLHEAGWVSYPLGPALFMIYDAEDKITGVVIAHVEDLLCCGEGPIFRAAVDKIRTSFKSKEKESDFVFCGKRVQQDADCDVFVDQVDAAKGFEFIVTTPERREHLLSACAPDEISEIRRVVGAVGWLARHSRPDLLPRTSLLAQDLSRPTVTDLVSASKLVKMTTKFTNYRLVLRADSNIDYTNCRLLCSSDAAFANADFQGEKIKSQVGYVLAVREKDGPRLHDLEFATGAIRRVCRSTLAEEANSLVAAVDAADYLRSVLPAMIRPDLAIKDLLG